MIKINVLSWVVSVLFNIVLAFVNIILSPIDVLISTAFPWLNNYIDYFNNLIEIIRPYISWIVNLSCLSSLALNFIVFTITFKVTTTVSTWTIKLAMKWYSKLKG